MHASKSAAEILRSNMFEVCERHSKRPSVRVGVLIKVGIRGERFWCRVEAVRGDGALVATVNNELIRSPWKCGDEIVVQNSHVLEASDPNDMTFANLVSVLGSASAAVMSWHELRSRSGAGARTKPETFFILPDC